MVHRGVKVHFASGYESADELIEELIERDSAPRRLTVVSSDHRLHRAARRRKAHAIDSDRWYEQTIAERSQRHRVAKSKMPKPPTPLATSEVEYWLAQFGDEPRSKSRPRAMREVTILRAKSRSTPRQRSFRRSISIRSMRTWK